MAKKGPSTTIVDTGGGPAINGNVNVESGQFIGVQNIILPPGERYKPPVWDGQTLEAPGGLPPGSRLSVPRNACFVGREQELRTLAARLLSEHQQRALIAGLGGMGKTQLTVEFCSRYGRFFDGVHWVQVSAGFEAEIAACGAALGLPGWPEKQPEQVERTLVAWRTEGSKHLVVLDGVDGEETNRLGDWLAKLSGLCVLVTSRRSHFPAVWGLKGVELSELEAEEARRLLRSLAGELLAGQPDGLVDALAHRLGRLPLALELAGRYLSWRQIDLATYLQQLEQVLKRPEYAQPERYEREQGQARSLTAAFALSWEQVRGEEQAEDLFRACGWCAEGVEIPLTLLKQVFGVTSAEEEAFDQAIRRLSHAGLLQSGPGWVWLHGLLAEYGQLQDGEKAVLARLADGLARASNAANGSGLPEAGRSLQPHLRAVAEAAESAGQEAAGALWNNLGYWLEMVADYAGARACFERALRIREAALGPEHPQVARVVNNLGGVLHGLGDLAGARACYERALRIREAALGPEHPQVATAVNNLGGVLQDLGDLGGARACFERALRIWEAARGPEHPQVARAVNNLGGVLHDLGDLGGARACSERALPILETARGPEHPEVATAVNNLGRVLKDLGDLAGARACFERALQIWEAALGPEHPDVATAVNNLGLVLKDLGDLAGARVCLERALAILETARGPEHPDVATAVNNLGRVLHGLGDLGGARACFERALASDERSYGPEHPQVATAVNNLGLVLHDLGDLAGARACYERALRILRLFLPPDHPNLRIVAENLQAVMEQLGKRQ